MSPPLTLFFFLHISTAPIFSCLLNGKISGKCVEKSALKSEVSFCYKYLPTYVCVPELHEIWGDWRNATVDFIIEERIIKNLKEEFMFELSENNYSLPLINNIGTTRIRFVVIIANRMQMMILCLSMGLLHCYGFQPGGNCRN